MPGCSYQNVMPGDAMKVGSYLPVPTLGCATVLLHRSVWTLWRAQDLGENPAPTWGVTGASGAQEEDELLSRPTR